MEAAVNAHRTTRLRFFIYIRVSTEREKMCSPKIQLRGCLRHAEKYDLEIIGEPVEDLDKTGRYFGERSLGELIERVRRGEADGVLIFRINRWGREAEQCMAYLKDLMAAGGQLVSTKEVVDMTTSSGRKAIRDAFSDAEYESDVIGDNWRSAHEDRWEAGLPHSGREIFGYRRCPDCRRRKDRERSFEYCESCEGVLQPDYRTASNTEGEATQVARAGALVEFYERLVSGEKMSPIVIDMARRGVRSLNGAVMDAQSWYRVLDTGFAAGYVRRKSERNESKSHKPEDYDIWIEGLHKALISVDLWERYKLVRALRQKDNHYNKASKFVSGLAKCYRVCASSSHDDGTCRGNMVSFTMMSKSRGKVKKRIAAPAFRCSKYVQTRTCPGVAITRRQLERCVVDWLEAQSMGSESMDEKIRAAARVVKERLEATAKIEAKISSLHSRKASLEKLFTDPENDSGMSAGDYRDTMGRFNAAIGKKEAELKELKEKIAASKAPPAPEVFQGIRREWPRLSEARKRQMLGRVIDRIEIRPRVEGEKFSGVTIFGVWDAA